MCQKSPMMTYLMALGGCSGGVLVTAAVAILLLPAHYYLPELSIAPNLPPPDHKHAEQLPTFPGLDLALQLPLFDLCIAVTILFIGFVTYLCEWIQRKIMERRIIKLNQYLSANLLRLRDRDAQCERQEEALRLTRAATAEYGLLLYLLLRRHRGDDKPPHDDGINYVRSSAYEHQT